MSLYFFTVLALVWIVFMLSLSMIQAIMLIILAHAKKEEGEE